MSEGYPKNQALAKILPTDFKSGLLAANILAYGIEGNDFVDLDTRDMASILQMFRKKASSRAKMLRRELAALEALTNGEVAE